MAAPDPSRLDWLNAELPPFGRFDPARDGLPALEAALDAARDALERAARAERADWAQVMTPVEWAEERIERVWGPVRHLAMVADDEALRPVHEAGEAKLAAFYAEALQHRAWYRRLRAIDPAGWSPARRAAWAHRLREMRLAGVELDGPQRARLIEIQRRLAELGARFEQRVLDAVRDFRLHITDPADLAGLPATVRESARARARRAGLRGWLFTLEPSSYRPFVEHAERRALRRRMHRAFVTRAAHPPHDNTDTMLEILHLRHEAARLLGFADFAEWAIAPRMCPSAEEAEAFVRRLIRQVRPHAEAELARVRAFAAERLGIDELMPWDLPFAVERLRQAEVGLDAEALRAWLPADRVVDGALALVGELFGLRFVEDASAPRWREDVRFVRVLDADGAPIGGLYLDLFGSARKRPGAWMDEAVLRWRRPDGVRQHPVAYVVADFAPPGEDGRARWTHDDLVTLFHELGHAMHHLLTEVDDARGSSGLRGVPWDAVELPSQWLEQLAWTPAALRRVSAHEDGGAPLPDDLIARLIRARRFLPGLRLARQLEFALVDLALHRGPPPADADALRRRVQQARDEAGVAPRDEDDRFENAFSHIFAGGYAAGYYSYLWAEALAADAWEACARGDFVDLDAARRFRRELLAVGGARPIEEAFIAFRGRPHDPGALLRLVGLTASESSAAAG